MVGSVAPYEDVEEAQAGEVHAVTTLVCRAVLAEAQLQLVESLGIVHQVLADLAPRVA